MKKRPFNLAVRAQADGDYEISVRGVIGEYLDTERWTMSDTQEDVLNELAKIPADKQIAVRINSIGGSVELGLGILNALSRRKDKITTYNDGFACSAAALIMLAGHRRVAPQASLMMIHCSAGGMDGNAKDARTLAECLEAIDNLSAQAFATISGKKTKEEFLAMMDKTTWLTGEQAVELGLATECQGEVEETEEDAATAKAELAIVSRYKNAPETLRSRLAVRAQAVTPPPTKPQPTQVKSMKKITAALVAAGIITATAEEHTEDSILAHLNPLLADNKRLKEENLKHIEARKKRVTDVLAAAVTDKVIAEARQTSLLALGTASAEGETEVMAQITDLRAAKVVPAPRGAKPAKAGAGEEEDESARGEARLEEIQTELSARGVTAEKRATLTAESLKLRGLTNLFAPKEAPARN